MAPAKRTLRLVAAVVCAALGVPTAHALDVEVVGAPPALSTAITRAARAAERVCERWYEIEYERPVSIEWSTDSAMLQRFDMEATGSVAGLAWPVESRIVLSAPVLSANPQRLEPVVLHEMSHLFFAAATAGAEVSPPRWLDEGIAMHLSGDWDLGFSRRSDDRRLLRDASAAGSLVPFADLDSSFPEGPFFQLAYAQSLSFVEWLAGRRGEAGLRALLDAFDRDLDPGPAMTEIYGETLESAEAAWSAQLRSGGWLGRLPSAETMFSALWIGLGLLVVLRFARTRWQLRRVEEDIDE